GLRNHRGLSGRVRTLQALAAGLAGEFRPRLIIGDIVGDKATGTGKADHGRPPGNVTGRPRFSRAVSRPSCGPGPTCGTAGPSVAASPLWSAPAWPRSRTLTGRWPCFRLPQSRGESAHRPVRYLFGRPPLA